MRHRITAAALTGAAVLAAAATTTSRPVITQGSVTDMAIGLTGHQTFKLRVCAYDAKGIKSIRVLNYPRNHASGWWRLAYGGNTTDAPATSTQQWINTK